MKALDGRNPHKVPEIIEIANPKMEKVVEGVYCLYLDDKLVPCVERHFGGYDYILCGSYKTKRGFDNWIRRMI